MAWAAWYQVSAANFACKQHPGPSRALVKAFAEYTHLAEGDAEHVIERVRHLHYCCVEQVAITLLRLQQGKNQSTVDRSSIEQGKLDAENLGAHDQ